MKKFFSIMCCLLMVLSGCGSNLENVDNQQIEPIDLSGYITTEEYSCIVDDSFRYYILFVTNTSDVTVKIDANILAHDENNQQIASYSEVIHAVAPNQTSCIWTTFDEWDSITSFDYNLQVQEQSSVSAIYDKVVIEYKLTDDKIIASATNQSEEVAKFVWLNVVFLKDGKMVNFRELSLMNDDCELLPSTTLSAEGICYSENGFDDVRIALNGRIE